LEGTGIIYMANTDLLWAPIVNESTLYINLLIDATSNSTSYYFGINSGYLGVISEQAHTTAVGFFSGSNFGTGDYNTAIGSETGALKGTTNLHNTTTLGYNAKADASHQVVLGTLSETVIIPGSVRIHSQEDPPDINVGVGMMYVETVDSNLYYYNGHSWNQMNPTVYQVGDIAMGGVIFYVDETGQHGLIVALENINDKPWSTSKNLTNAVGRGYYAGEMNTLLIAASEASHSSHTFAAGSCIWYSRNFEGTEYGDWYLPSVKELQEIYSQKAVLNVSLGAYELISEGLHWSSEEFETDQAYTVNMVDGTNPRYGKTGVRTARPVRRF